MTYINGSMHNCTNGEYTSILNTINDDLRVITNGIFISDYNDAFYELKKEILDQIENMMNVNKSSLGIINIDDPIISLTYNDDYNANYNKKIIVFNKKTLDEFYIIKDYINSINKENYSNKFIITDTTVIKESLEHGSVDINEISKQRKKTK